MTAKKPKLWFEKPDDKASKDDFFENVEKSFTKPTAIGSLVTFPEFKAGLIPVKMAETKKELLLKASLPGFSKEDIKLKVTPHLVYISAQKKHTRVNKLDNFLKSESSSSSASRILRLPKEAKTEGARARYRDDVLEVVIQKKED